MKIFGMGLPELIIILVVVLIIFGPKALPKLGSSLGKGMRNLREGLNGGKKKAEAEEAEGSDEADGDEDSAGAEEASDDEDEAEPSTKKASKKSTKKASKSE